MKAADFIGRSQKELAELFARGEHFDTRVLHERVYEGVSLGLPKFIEAMTWVKFAKAFHFEPSTQQLRGWNIRIAQNPLDEPWTPLLRKEKTVNFGHFRVVDRAGEVELDYGQGRNGRFDVTSLLRDPLVRIDECGLLLGRSYLRFWGMNIATPSWFVLQPGQELTELVAPPRASD